MADSSSRYTLSLTGAGTYKAETLTVAREYLECGDWTEVRRLIVDENLISLNSDGNRKRIGGEIVKRLKTLNADELSFLDSSLDDDQLAMLWVMLCRTYPILREFSTGVLAERYNNMMPDLPKSTYQAFAEEQKLDHPELAALTENSQKKVEIRVFGMLRDCHLIDGDFNITPLYPTGRFVSLLQDHAPDDLKLLPKAGALL